MSTYTDKEIVCICGAPFVWTLGEQRFMETLLKNGKILVAEQPKRCKKCRELKKLNRKK